MANALNRPRLRWLLLAFALGAAIALPLAPSASSAHALLDHADPPAESKLAQPPSQLTLYFAQALVPASSWILLRDSRDNDIPVQLSFDPADPRVMRAALPVIQPGVYTVKWQTQSADDDDYAQGSYHLTVLKADGSSPAGASSGGGSGLLYGLGGGLALVVAGGGAFWLRRRSAP